MGFKKAISQPMKPLRVLILLLTALSFPAFAADSANPVHWYRITITVPGATQSFTGSSPLDATQMAASLTNIEAPPISLENRREQFQDDNRKLEYGWHPYEPGSKVFVFPRTILYFEELPGDPAAQSH